MAPLFLGIDMHTLSAPALSAALEVVAANGVEVMIVEIDEYASTPAVSDAILTYNPPHGRPAKCKEDSIREHCSRLHNAPARLSRSVHKRSRQSGRHECLSCCGDQHGRESARRRGLAPPKHYLFQHRPNWRESAAVGFEWFVDGLLDGSLCFGGEESGGASFARLESSVWTTYKDGIVPALLSAERLAPGNSAPIGGVKVIDESAWFAARPTVTESIYRIYAESFSGQDHLRRVIEGSQTIVNDEFERALPPHKLD